MELNMENIVDLFSDEALPAAALQVREDSSQGVYVEGLVEKVAKTREELMAAIRRGARSRFSRSQARTHAILQIFLEQRWTAKTEGAAKVVKAWLTMHVHRCTTEGR